jgi:hypothetical protein
MSINRRTINILTRFFLSSVWLSSQVDSAARGKGETRNTNAAKDSKNKIWMFGEIEYSQIALVSKTTAKSKRLLYRE